MDKYCTEQCVQILKLFYQSNKSIIQTQRAYHQYYRVIQVNLELEV